MAGDWIKMRVDLAEDPAVIGIAARLGLDEFSVVGRLQALWSWADGQSRDGHAGGVTAAWVNRKVQRDGFAEAMVEVGWLAIEDDGISFPNFTNHNGETAKTRALGKNRQQKKRASEEVTQPPSQTSRNERDKSVTREEKRREESNTVPNGTDGDAVKPTSDLSKDELWKAGKSLLNQAGMPVAQCGSFVGKLVKDYGDQIVVEAVRTAVVSRPADPAEYLKATCMRAAGQRATPEPAWRAEQRVRTHQAAPGVAVGAIPADQFFIETEALHVTPRRLG